MTTGDTAHTQQHGAQASLRGKTVTFERRCPQEPTHIQTVRDVVEWASDCGYYFRLSSFGPFGLNARHPETDRIVHVSDDA